MHVRGDNRICALPCEVVYIRHEPCSGQQKAYASQLLASRRRTFGIARCPPAGVGSDRPYMFSASEVKFKARPECALWVLSRQTGAQFGMWSSCVTHLGLDITDQCWPRPSFPFMLHEMLNT